MMICNAKWQPLNEEAKSGFTFGCCIRGLLRAAAGMYVYALYELFISCFNDHFPLGPKSGFVHTRCP